MKVVKSGATMDSKSRSCKLSSFYFHNNLRQQQFCTEGPIAQKLLCASGREEEKERGDDGTLTVCTIAR